MKRKRTLIQWAPLALTIPAKYLLPKRGNLLFFAISFATLFSAFICTAVALLALAATNGADIKISEKLSGIDSHVLVFPSDQYQTYMSGFQKLTPKLKEVPEIVAISPFLVCEAQLQSSVHDAKPLPATLKGIIAEQEISATNLVDYIEQGNLLSFLEKSKTELPILLGAGLAQNLNLSIDDELLIVRPELFNGEIRKFPTKIAGIFRTGIGLDYHLAYIPLDQAQLIAGVGDSTVTGIGIKGKDLLKADQLAMKVKKELGDKYRIEDWKSINPNVLGGISLLRNVSIILLYGVYLLVLVCLSCILLLVLHEKRRDIAVLLTLGMKPFHVQRAFAFLGLLIGVTGIAFAFLVSPIVIWVFNEYKIFALPPEVLMIDYVHFALELKHFLMVGLSELFLLILVGLLTTIGVYRLKPMVILRDE